MSVSECCLKGFEWGGTPQGREEKLGDMDTYVVGDNAQVAILMVADLLGWTFANTRLVADHLAAEVGATVYVPDFFAGDVLEAAPILANEWRKVDIGGWMRRNTRRIRDPQVIEAGKLLRARYKKLGAAGYCYGGWAAFRLGSKEHQPPIVDCISVGHPSLLERGDIDKIAVPVQILAPEHDPVFTKELKLHSFQKIQELGIPFAYQHFPGVEHSCLVRGDEKKPGERVAMARGKNAAVTWFKQFLLE